MKRIIFLMVLLFVNISLLCIKVVAKSNNSSIQIDSVFVAKNDSVLTARFDAVNEIAFNVNKSIVEEMKSLHKEYKRLFIISLGAGLALLIGLMTIYYIWLSRYLDKLKNKSHSHEDNFNRNDIDKKLEKCINESRALKMQMQKDKTELLKKLEEVFALVSSVSTIFKPVTTYESHIGGNCVTTSPVILYGDAIKAGKINKVTETPNEDTIFELKLEHAGAHKANLTIAERSHRRILARTAFLDGCDKHVLGSTHVLVDKEGSVTLESDGTWILTTKPTVTIK